MIIRLFEARYAAFSLLLAAVALYWLIKAARARWRDSKAEQRVMFCQVCGRVTEGGWLCTSHKWGCD